MSGLPSTPFAHPLVHGHRGCRGLRPENTLPAFLHALELGVDVLELDVVVSADNEVVVSHEPWFAAATCLDPQAQSIPRAQEQSHNLYQLPYAAIRRYDCGQLRHPEFPEQQPEPAYKPLLREVLAAVEHATQQLGRLPVGYSIEVKSEADGDGIFHPVPERFLSLVLAELHSAHVLVRTCLLSFDHRVLQAAHQTLPTLATCLLTEEAEPWPLTIQRLSFEPTVLGPDFHLASPAAVTELRLAFPALQLVPWTVNELSDLQQVLTWGVDGITTDYPDRLLALLQRV